MDKIILLKIKIESFEKSKYLIYNPIHEISLLEVSHHINPRYPN